MMKPHYLIMLKSKILLASVLIFFSITLYPVSVSEPYEVTEMYVENYTVVEPGIVQVSDWVRENVTINRSFIDSRYSYEDLMHEASMVKCGYISYIKGDLSYSGWGKINLLPYGNEVYFAGYTKGKIVSRETNTFNLTSRTGHVYNILKNDNAVSALKEGEYLSLSGYSVQVNSIGKKKSGKTVCEQGHYVPEDEEEDSSRCTAITEESYGATLSLLDMNIVRTWDANNGSTLIYEKTLYGGETIPAILLHFKEINGTHVVVDGIFQISLEPANIPELGAQVVTNIKNIDTYPGTFEVYLGFILNGSLGFEIGKLEKVFLNPSDSGTLIFTTSRDIEDCRFFSRSISKKPIPENFTNYRNVTAYKKRTEYRNVTLYMDVVKSEAIERNAMRYRNRTMFLWEYLYRRLI